VNAQTSTENMILAESQPAALNGTTALVSLAAAGIGVAALAALHFLSPEFDPSFRMISEYATGNHEWALALMFLSLAAGCVALFVALRSQAHTRAAKIGLGFLIATGVGLAMAAAFDIEHPLHGLASLIGIPAFPIASLLISGKMARSTSLSPAQRLLLVLANVNWISLVLMFAALGVTMAQYAQSGGEMTTVSFPGSLIGWMNRLYVVSLGIWLMVAAWHVNRAAK
jgi:hypothetical protein